MRATSQLSRLLRSVVIHRRGRLAAGVLLLGTLPASAGLVAYWPFSSEATLGNDAARGTALSATGATYTAAGKSGGGLALDGNNQYLSGTVPNLPAGNSTYSQTAWIKPTLLGARGIVGWGNYGAVRQVNALRLAASGSGLTHYWGSADLEVTNLSTTLNDGNWHHVATTWDGVVRRIYLDGIQAAIDAPGSNGATTANFRIGSTNGAEFFSGTLDDVAIYNNALTAAEVQALASGGSPLGGPFIASFSASPATAYEGDPVTLSWNVTTATVTGTFSYEIALGATTLSSGTATSGSFLTTVPDLAGTPQTLTWTLRAIETGGNAVTTTAVSSLAANPGIPAANGQAGLIVRNGTPLPVLLSGSDPNNGPLRFLIVTPPAHGSLTRGTGADRVYSATPGYTGPDEFTFKVSDGKYESAPATIKLTVTGPSLPPTGIIAADTTIRPEKGPGDFITTLSSPDSNAGEAHTFTFASGPGGEENQRFTISGNQLISATSFANLAGETQRLRLRSTDAAGLWIEQNLIFQVVPKTRGVIINEIHYNGINNVIRNSFIELYNDGPFPADLSNWRLSGDVDYLIPAGTTLAPDAYLIIAEDPATILSTWSKTALGPWDNATVLYPDGSKESNGLPNDGGTIRLRDASNKVTAEVDYNNHSPWPSQGNGEGYSIELKHPSLDPTHGSNWSAAKLPGTVTYIPPASSGWKYFKSLTPPATTWKARTGADLTGWLEGTTTAGNATIPWFGFGYADNDDAVLLPDMRRITAPIAQNGYQAVYFRHQFTLEAGKIPNALALRVYIDDGCVIYLNGVEIPVRFYVGSGTPTQAAGAVTIGGISITTHEAAPNNWDSYTITNTAPYNLTAGTNVLAVLAINSPITSDDFSFNLEMTQGTGSSDQASPGARNISYSASAAPAIRKVEHTPVSPTSLDPIVITARITDPQGVAAAFISWQTNAAGAYIPSTLPKAILDGNFVNVTAPLAANPAFENPANWNTTAMNDDGLGDDALGGDGIWTGTIPARANRTLVRYRITTADNSGNSARIPYPGDPSLNFACFVYNGVPDYEGTSSADLQKFPVYHFLTRKSDYDQCVAYDNNSASRLTAGPSWSYENWEACFVCNGTVYDHIPYRLKGANGRYTASGTGGAGNAKRAFKFLFNKGYEFDARDQLGKAYPEKWATMITENLWENRASYTFSLNEHIDSYLFNKLGVPAPAGHWAHFRTVMQTAEQPDKWRGDFWGLMWVHEDYDKRFLKAHGLKKGNLYKLTRDGTAGLLQFRYQSTFGPVNGSDHDDLLNNLKGTSTPAYINARVNLDLWCRYHAFCEAIRHYDYWPNGDNNAGWYFYPNYSAANGNKGVLWYLPNDLDATWGPTWNNGHDLVHNALFNDSASSGGDANTNPTLWPNYFNQVREIRALLWQPDQINPLIDQFAAVIRPIANAEFKRWVGGPSDAGNFGGLFGPGDSALGTVGQTALDRYIAGMKDFAFDANGGGSNWPGDAVAVGGRAAFLDKLGSTLAENATKYPATPTISYLGNIGNPINDLRFSTTAFSDPQGANTFSAIQWRMAQVNPSSTYIPAEPRLLEINASYDSGAIPTFSGEFKYPATACTPGNRYRARVRMKDTTGRWSYWSPAYEFTAGAFDPAAYASQLVVSELMYHSANPTAAERAAGAALVPAQAWNDDSFDYVELRNIGSSPLDLTGFQFTSGFDFAFPDGTILAPGASLLVVQNTAAFTARYGNGKPIAGAWQATDRLSNGGETITLQFGNATPPVFSFTYNDDPALNWPAAADGAGYSLVRIHPEDPSRNAGLGLNWRSSLTSTGSPGTDDRVSYASWLGATPEGDPDQDGLNNIVEYALGSDPLTPSATASPAAAWQTISVEGTPGLYPTLTFIRANAHEDFSQQVEFSPDLLGWPIRSVQVSATDLGNGTRREVWRADTPGQPGPGTRVYGRLRFTRP